MTQGYDTMVWRTEAVERVRALRETALETRGRESIDPEAIADRTLAAPIVASENRPAHDRATMDGFAFDATAEYPLEVVSAVFPEDSPPEIGSGQAVEIATGAPLPEGANAVLKREDATTEKGKLSGKTIEPGTDVHRRGSTVTAGETLFENGERLSPKDAVLLADLGIETVAVYERPRVGVLATGTEIHEGRRTDSDSAMLGGLVRSWGGKPVYEGTVPDDYAVVETRIDDLAGRYDVVITTGGTSVGKKDYVIRALDALGEVAFHQVRVRPGKPIAAARLPERDAIAFAIPGKPLGAHTIATLVMRSFFANGGPVPTVEATLSRSVGIEVPGFEYAIPVTLSGERNEHGSTDAESVPEAMALGHVDSSLPVYENAFDASVLSSNTRATRADGIVLTETTLAAGDRVPVVPYSVLE